MSHASDGNQSEQQHDRIRVRGSQIIVDLQPDHWKAVRAITVDGISTGNSTFERKAPDWEEWNANHIARCRFVALHEDQVIGYAALSPISPRPVYAGVAEVEVVVAALARAQGVGRALMKRLVDGSEAAGIWMLQASLFPENEAGLKVLAEQGFREVGRRERIGKHFSRWRDIILLERRSRRVGAEKKEGRPRQ